MNALFLYLFKSTVCLSLLYAVYWFILRKDTFFQLNRFYLLSMMLCSMLIPLFPMHWIATDPSAAMVILLEPVLITPGKVEQTLIEHLQWIEMATIIYITGVVIFLLRFGLQLYQLQRITRQFGIKVHEGNRVVFVDRNYSPFSFFNLIYINKEALPSGSLRTILEHEQVHIRQHHTADMLILELVTILQWFNPLTWLTGREMKSIHEYLADEAVLQNGISRSIYQQMILNETMGIQVNNLTNNFNVSLLKKRIAMMTKSKSKTWAKLKVLLALPAMIVLLIFFTSISFSGEANSGGLNTIQLTPDMVIPAYDLQDVPVEAAKPQEKKSAEKEVFTVVEKPPTFVGGHDALVRFLLENIQYPAAAKEKIVQGTVYITFIVEPDGAVTNVKVMRGIGSGCDEEAFRVVSMMPKWNPGEQRGKFVRVQFNLPIKFKLDKDKKDEPKK